MWRSYTLKERYYQEYSMKYIYSISQISKLSLTLCTLSVTSSVAGLFLTSFFTGYFLNTKSFVLNIILLSLFHSSTSLLPLSAYHFISSCVFLNTTSVSSCTFFILSANSVVFSIFSFL